MQEQPLNPSQQPSAAEVQKSVQPIAEQATRKLGEGALEASWRQGMKEFGQMLKALPDSLPIIEEPGQMNNPTSQAVSQQAGYTQPVRVVESTAVDKHLSDVQNMPTPQQQMGKDMSI